MSQFTKLLNPAVIDEDRYSRQSYAVGQDVMTRLSEAKTLVIGYNILGQEIVKNMALQGIGKIDICFKFKLENYQKTGLYYPVENLDLPLQDIRNLNPTIEINQIDVFDSTNEFNSEIIKQYNLVIINNSTFEDALSLNRICHKLSIKFILCGCYGLSGYIFNDFGDNFVVSDIDGEVYENLLINTIEDNKIIFKDKHNLADDDILILTTNDNIVHEIKINRTLTPIIIFLKEEFTFIKSDIKSIIKKKIPKTFNFVMLKDSMDMSNMNITIGDYSFDFNRSSDLYELFLAYSKFYEEYHTDPRAWSLADFEFFTTYIKDFKSKTPEFVRLAKKFCFTLRGNVLPFSSIIGAIVSHECIKALGHKYVPITQWYFTDYLELISDEEIDFFDDNKARNYRSTNKYEGLVNVFGKKILEKIQHNIPFVVGSGAIGCEILKNLSMIGVITVIVADPDHIEKSNLSRQFLFNDKDIRKSKAKTAAEKIKIFNSDCKPMVFENKVCGETEHIFNSDFFQQIDTILNALDNVDARIYMDEQAIKYSCPLIDSGTMGAKANVQVVIPDLTESYGSSKDPDEKSGIPICTIKSFPYKSEHTIQWARELFETEFYLVPSFIEKFRDLSKLIGTNDGDIKLFYRQIYKYKNFTLDKQGFFNLLSTIFYENFHENIMELIEKYNKPENTEELGEKKLPKVIQMTPEFFNQFMILGFNLLSQMFKTNITYNYNHDQVSLINTENFDLNNFSPIIFGKNLDDIIVDDAFDQINKIIQLIPTTFKVDFEKDDDILQHVQFVTECANIRNYQYSIPTSDVYTTRKIAGNIIPAMITTTSLISGFQILEYIKIIKLYNRNKHITTAFDSDINLYKNRFVNLNNNYIDGINPGRPERQIINSKSISVWTKISVNSDITADIIEQINQYTKNKVEYLTAGTDTIYDGDDVLIQSVNFNSKVLALIMIGEKPIELKIIKN